MTDVFQRPTKIERTFNRLFGALVRLGVAPVHSRVLEVRGRKTGKLYTAPVFVLERERRLFLVAPRGETQWVKNAEVSGRVTLRAGHDAKDYRLTLLPPAERAPLLREYLGRHKHSVQRFFSVQRGAPLEAFAAIADRHPVFALDPV